MHLSNEMYKGEKITKINLEEKSIIHFHAASDITKFNTLLDLSYTFYTNSDECLFGVYDNASKALKIPLMHIYKYIPKPAAALSPRLVQVGYSKKNFKEASNAIEKALKNAQPSKQGTLGGKRHTKHHNRRHRKQKSTRRHTKRR
jgi:hypothetical protein